MSHTVTLSIQSCKQINRLRNLLRNPQLRKWYYNQFFSFGIIPIDPRQAEEDMDRWQEILDYIIEEAEKDGFKVPPE